MTLYLIRHADAVDGSPDETRALSKRGRDQVKHMAEMLRAGGEFAPLEIWHSSLLRAVQTTDLLVNNLGLTARLREVRNLEPDGSVGAIATRLESVDKSLAIVGHNPHLTLLGTLLVSGPSAPPAFIMRKCSVLALEPARGFGVGCWVASWHLAPDLLE